MSSIISRLLERFYSPGSGYTAMMLGLDASGKTTLLYRMKLGEIVQTIPTIGFNVETLRLKARGRTDRLLNLTCWDVGGCGRGYLTGIFVQYAATADAIIWLIDSSDRSRLEESIQEFSSIMERLAADRTIPQRTRPVLILATKQDAPNAMLLDEIRLKVAPATRALSVFCVGTSLTQSLSDGPLPDAFGWLLAALESVRNGKPPPLNSSSSPTVSSLNTRTPGSGSSEERLQSWLTRTEGDSSAAKFLHQFKSINLPSWDHYTHIRIAYLMLQKFGRQKGKDMIFEGIERYISQSAQTRGRTFHVTMTYFWIQIVHFGIRSTPPLAHSDTNSDLGDISLKLGEHEEIDDDFSRFLLLNPFVADGNLWSEYYSKGVMMNVEAKTGMVLPDVKPLPNLVVRDAISVA
ncbi:ADP-ribosylation factor [Mycena crocata]|nr:ADP-ribosylation factor [Mycena crocata]